MEDLNHVLTFARVVEAGSFTGAGQRLRLAPSVVSKHIAKLERALGARLLQRSTRKLSLTEAGRAYYAHCARIVEALEQSQQAVASLQAEPSGRLRVSALNSFVSHVLAPLLPEFLQRYPRIELEIITSDRPVDLAEEGFDLALRITPSEIAPNLVARRLAPIDFRLCATPAYLRRHGEPRHPRELAAHNCLGYPLAPLERLWHFAGPDGSVAVPARGRVNVNNIEALTTLALADAGLALLPTYAIGAELASGRLVIVLPNYRGFGQGALYAVQLPNRYGSPKLRAFVDYLVECIGDPPAWERGRARSGKPPARRR